MHVTGIKEQFILRKTWTKSGCFS